MLWCFLGFRLYLFNQLTVLFVHHFYSSLPQHVSMIQTAYWTTWTTYFHNSLIGSFTVPTLLHYPKRNIRTLCVHYMSICISMRAWHCRLRARPQHVAAVLRTLATTVRVPSFGRYYHGRVYVLTGCWQTNDIRVFFIIIFFSFSNSKDK